MSSARLDAWLFSFYTILLIVLPTGNFFGLNVKMVAFVPLFFVMLFRAIGKRTNPYWMLSCLVGVPLYFCYWVFPGQTGQYDLSLAFAQYRNLLITLAGCWFALVYISEDRTRSLSFIRLVLWVVAAMSVLKVLVTVYCLMRGIPVSTIMNGIGNFFGIKLMSFELDEADPDAVGSRIMFTSDLLLAPCCFAAIAMRRRLGFGRLTMFTLLLLYVVSVIFGFSRFHWAFCGLAIVLGFAVAKGEKWILLLLVAAVVLSALFIPAISGILALRFASNLVSDSDAPRHVQIAALSRFFWNAPLLGHGWGTYARDCIRSTDFPYSYEVELLALLGQIGIVGVLSLFLLAGRYFKSLFQWRKNNVIFRMAMLALLTTFIVGGTTNPMLLTSISSVSYALFLMLGDLSTEPALQLSSKS
ncbi:hypothetical protein AciX9_3857 (plasmid) [Granulicella tundricola MP5ACTX9]|uniref:O-antigen polymerase n=2 Tax=Granulicella TaxID=940557 RepID=E8X731_GRATM|nr:hypothetical protein AciX9_3857 [Granulicella tundricola MP5ACTX9]